MANTLKKNIKEKSAIHRTQARALEANEQTMQALVASRRSETNRLQAIIDHQTASRPAKVASHTRRADAYIRAQRQRAATKEATVELNKRSSELEKREKQELEVLREMTETSTEAAQQIKTDNTYVEQLTATINKLKNIESSNRS